MKTKNCCENCRHWLGSRDHEWNLKHEDQKAACHVHQPKTYFASDVCECHELRECC